MCVPSLWSIGVLNLYSAFQPLSTGTDCAMLCVHCVTQTCVFWADVMSFLLPPTCFVHQPCVSKTISQICWALTLFFHSSLSALHQPRVSTAASLLSAHLEFLLQPVNSIVLWPCVSATVSLLWTNFCVFAFALWTSVYTVKIPRALTLHF